MTLTRRFFLIRALAVLPIALAAGTWFDRPVQAFAGVITIPARTYQPLERFETPSFTIPATVNEASVALNLSAAQIHDPATDVMGIIEWAPAGTPDNSPLWSHLASVRVVGNPLSRVGTPFIAITPDTMALLHDNLVRGVVVNSSETTPITFPATVTFS